METINSINSVDATLILHKNMPFQCTNGLAIKVSLHVFECENPYALIFMITEDDSDQTRSAKRILLANFGRG